MRVQHYILFVLFMMFAIVGNSQTYIFSKDAGCQITNDLTLTLDPAEPSETLRLQLGGYLQEDIDDVTIMTEVGLSVKSWQAVNSKDVELDLTELERQKPYLIHLKTSSGEVIIEKFVKV